MARPAASSCGILAEEQVLHRVVVGGDAFDGLVAARRLGFQAGLLGGLDGGQQRDLAVVAEIHADAEVDLGGLVSALKASLRPRIGSRGAISTAAKRRGHESSGCGRNGKSALAERRIYVAARSAQ
jgi:hypothetical protein